MGGQTGENVLNKI